MAATPKRSALASPAASQFAIVSSLQSSLVCSSSTINNGNRSKLFSSFAFLVTGIPQECVRYVRSKKKLCKTLMFLCRADLEKQLIENGGSVISSDLSLSDLRFELSRYDVNSSAAAPGKGNSRNSRSVVALSVLNGGRHPKYLLCLALHLPLLHYSWAFDSLARKHLKAVEEYVLPSGPSPLHAYYLFSNIASHTRGVFYGIRVVNCASDVWRELLLCAGATVLPADKHANNADYFLVDALDYTEEKLSQDSLSVLYQASSVVTVDWFVYCLQTNQLTDPAVCPSLFLLPPDPIRHPTTIKTQSSLRYMIYDVVSYKNYSNSGIGLIRTFSRKDRKSNSSVLIKLTPLRVQPITTNGENLRHLTPRVNMDILISSEWLTGRLIVFSQEAATMVHYARNQKDASVYVSSVEWENRNGVNEEEDTSNKKCSMQLSQDS